MTANSLRWILAALAGMALLGCKKDKAEAEKPAASAQTLEKKPSAKADRKADAARRRDPGAILARFDANKDGKLEVSELPERRRQRLGLADTNKDGVISREELEKFGPLGGKGMDPTAIFSQLDTNKDGKLEPSELPEVRRERLMKGDANKDGALSSDELKAHIEARRRQRGAP